MQSRYCIIILECPTYAYIIYLRTLTHAYTHLHMPTHVYTCLHMHPYVIGPCCCLQCRCYNCESISSPYCWVSML